MCFGFARAQVSRPWKWLLANCVGGRRRLQLRCVIALLPLPYTRVRSWSSCGLHVGKHRTQTVRFARSEVQQALRRVLVLCGDCEMSWGTTSWIRGSVCTSEAGGVYAATAGRRRMRSALASKDAQDILSLLEVEYKALGADGEGYLRCKKCLTSWESCGKIWITISGTMPSSRNIAGARPSGPLRGLSRPCPRKIAY